MCLKGMGMEQGSNKYSTKNPNGRSKEDCLAEEIQRYCIIVYYTIPEALYKRLGKKGQNLFKDFKVVYTNTDVIQKKF